MVAAAHVGTHLFQQHEPDHVQGLLAVLVMLPETAADSLTVNLPRLQAGGLHQGSRHIPLSAMLPVSLTASPTASPTASLTAFLTVSPTASPTVREADMSCTLVTALVVQAESGRGTATALSAAKMVGSMQATETVVGMLTVHVGMAVLAGIGLGIDLSCSSWVGQAVWGGERGSAPAVKGLVANERQS